MTVLFADLVGFTPFAEERDAEDVRETLSRYFDLCSDIVGRYGGTIEKFIGDAVMAVWGAPVAHEDDAERAVRAALELVASVGSIAPDAQARAGVLTGEAAVTIGATNQGMVAGDIVNTASRLQSVAPPGAVLVGEATYPRREQRDLLRGGRRRSCSRARKRPSRRGGRCGSWPSVAGATGRERDLEAPFVGRDDELRLLKDLLHATAREKRTRLVSVMGPGGIGKSRLAWEFLKYVDGLVETIYWHSGRSPSYGEGITFWALGEMVRSRCMLVETDDEPTTRQKVAEAVAAVDPGRGRARRVEPALLTLLGFESGVPSDQLFGAWRTFFERIAEHGHRRAGVRGPPPRRLGPARLHRAHAGVEQGRTDLHRHAGASGAARQARRTGARPSATSRRSTSSRCPRRTCASCLPGSCPGLPAPDHRNRSSIAPTASRSTRSRPCACWSPTGG